MNVVDSSGWLAYFTNTSNAEFFAPPLHDQAELVVPIISIYEVFKRVLQQQDEQKAMEAVAVMMEGQVIDLDARLALSAAKLSVELKLPMTDSLILATARASGATLWTQDAHFQGLDDVRYVPAPSQQGPS